MNTLTMEDVNYLAQQSSGRINMILSGMTELMNDTDGKVAIMESQGWFQRMVKTVTGKNKLTQLEIQQNHDKLNAYMSEAIAELYNRNCIDHQVMMSLGTQLNELYADHLQLKNMLGAFVGKLNEKIDSVDNFHMLTTEINQGVYSHYSPLVAMCKVISQFDKRILEDNRKLDILKRSMIEQNIINNEEILLTEYLKSIVDVPVEDIGQIHLEISTIRDNFIARIILRMIEKYHFLPDMARKMKNKKTLIDEVIKEESLDDSIGLSISEIYDDFIKSKIDINYRFIPVQAVQEEKHNDSESEDLENILNTAHSYFWDEDYFNALAYLEKAYELGSGEAAYMIGGMYSTGWGVSVDKERAFRWMERAAELGSGEAAYSIMACYLAGDGVSVDKEKAFNWLERAADLGSVAGQTDLAGHYYWGNGVNQDLFLARQWYIKAANGGSDYAATEVGKMDIDNNNYEEAVKWFRKAAENGYDDAQYLLGDCYRNGQGVIENDEEAFRWFLKAAEQGHREARRHVFCCYYYGVGVAEDDDKAKEWLQKSAEQGDETAIEYLHEWYNEGSEDSSPILSDMLNGIQIFCQSFMSMHDRSNYEASYNLKSFFGILDEDVYLGHDDTLFKSGKNGFAITEYGIYCREMFGSYTNYVSFEELGNVENIYINGSEIYADGQIIAYITASSDEKEDLKKLFEDIRTCARLYYS